MTETPTTRVQSARRDEYVAALAGITADELRTAHPPVRESFRTTFGEKADAAVAVSDAEIQRNTDALRASWTAEVDHVTSQRDRARAEVLGEVVAWLVKKAREHRAQGPQYAKQADVIGVLADKVRRGAVRPNNLLTLPPGEEPAPEDVPALAAEVERLRAERDGLRDRLHRVGTTMRALRIAAVRGDMDGIRRRLTDRSPEAPWRGSDPAARPTRAEVLRSAAEVAVRAARGCGDSETGQYAASIAAAIGKELRGMADADGKDTRTAGESTHDAATVAYGDGGGTDHVWCLTCPRPDDATTAFDVNDIENHETCRVCDRYLIDVARAEAEGGVR